MIYEGEFAHGLRNGEGKEYVNSELVYTGTFQDDIIKDGNIIVKYVLDKCPDEMQFFDKFVENGLIDKLTKLINSKFVRVDHEEVISILKKADVKWEFEPQ